MARSYDNALALGKQVAIRVRKAAPLEKLAVMFDIDGTLLNDSKAGEYTLGGEQYLRPIKQIVQLLKLCYRLKYRVIIITARPRQSEEWTRKNLALEKIPYHALVFTSHKPRWKADLSAKENMRFILSVGDNLIDVQGQHSGVPILLKS